MAWSDEAWQEIEPLYRKILDSSFVSELGDGTLDKARFLRYMRQDKLYLNDYSRALALIAARAYTPQDTAQFAKFVLLAAEAQRTLHDFYLEFDDNIAVEKNVTCELYTSFLLRHAATSSLEVAAAAMLSCFWIYDAVGIYFHGQLKDGVDHPYVKWIQMYSSSDVTEGTQHARDFCDRLAENTTPAVRKQMTTAFVQATKMEYMFWKAAWDDEQWP